jgi:hypothetical protein
VRRRARSSATIKLGKLQAAVLSSAAFAVFPSDRKAREYRHWNQANGVSDEIDATKTQQNNQGPAL